MSKIAHRLYIISMIIIVIIVVVWLSYIGISYYKTALEERFFHKSYQLLKPSGTLGHGYGIFGTLLMIFGIIMYMARKRFRFLSRLGALKHWLEFHIFLCTLGPILVLFHTSFKFGGIVSVSFWSMVIVFLSGIIGRFIYIQIPRTIEGRELSLKEINDMKAGIVDYLQNSNILQGENYDQVMLYIFNSGASKADKGLIGYFKIYFNNRKTLSKIKNILKSNQLSKQDLKTVIALVKQDFSLNRKIERLVTMQKFFNYWHVAHLPFALVMLVIMVIHVAITIAFGYKWIF